MYGRPGDLLSSVCSGAQHLIIAAPYIKADALTKVLADRETGKATGGQPRLDTWRPATRDFRNLELAYQGREDEIASFDEQRAAQRDIRTLLIPPSSTAEQVRMWASACLLAAPFTNAVIRLHGIEEPNASRSLAATYNLGRAEARRGLETVQNWLAFLMPELLN